MKMVPLSGETYFRLPKMVQKATLLAKITKIGTRKVCSPLKGTILAVEKWYKKTKIWEPKKYVSPLKGTSFGDTKNGYRKTGPPRSGPLCSAGVI